MKKYNEIIKESTIIQESVPWRSSKVNIALGKTALDGLKQDCLVLNDLKFIMTFKPSFMFVVPDIKLLQKKGSGTNGWLITARKAQQLEYSISSKGTCSAYTYFFGRPKEGRSFDLIQRAFERGFSIEKINGLPGFSEDMKIEITVSKKDFMSTGFFAGKEFPVKDSVKVPARFTTK